jgi:hypothetical protein
MPHLNLRNLLVPLFEGHWKKEEVPSIFALAERGSRGSMYIDKKNNVFLFCGGIWTLALSIMGRQGKSNVICFGIIWRSEGFDSETLVYVQI